MNSYLLKGSLSGAFRYVENDFEFRTNTKYTIFDGPQHTIAVSTKMWKEKDGDYTAYKSTTSTKASALT